MTEPADDVETTVREAPDQNRFEIWAGGVLAGFTVYRARPEQYTFFHTEIDPEFGGRGLASILIKATLDEMRERGIAVLPQCPFVRRYISRHSEYLDLVPAADRAKFDLPAGAAAQNG